MSKKYLFINGHKSVAVEYDGDTVSEVYIDGNRYDFGDEVNPNKLDFANAIKRKKYAELLNNQFENLVILSGAGSSVGIGQNIIDDVLEIEIERTGKIMSDLWDAVEAKLTTPLLEKFCDLVTYTKFELEEGNHRRYDKNLEKLLSLATIAKNFVVDPIVETDEIKKIDIDKTIKIIEQLIKENCTLKLPDDAPHLLFIEKITKRKVTLPRVKVFTLNYDTLFEQAGRKKNFTIIDGFSFSHPRTFSGRNFDLDIVSRNSSRVKEEDNFVQKVFHLYKPHGSVDWTKENNEIIQRENVENPLMIFPKDSKYESSYEQPYFEMMSRFQQNLRNENVLLVCIGFSFNDKHLVTAIIEALEQNPSFQLVVVNRSIDQTSPTFRPIFEASKKHSIITLVSELFKDFADNYPDLKSYNQEDVKKIILNLNSNTDEQ
ncbi:SIR2 family protein [Kaistella sp. BT6-1-3]|uniref:SIR2 family protein n=1 Tax=Kaistella yananensis TaxID=2989820 RepID=A0ABT3JN83_9FLAO|nr:SIR2 family protein [Kaistella yananensis]MCW4452171.1 SIR2 family protein [Kaistella yananensis]